MMKKQLFLLVQLLIPAVLMAQENNSTTYSVVKITGVIVAAGFVIWGIAWWRKRKNKKNS
jgi:hypothetical protein